MIELPIASFRRMEAPDMNRKPIHYAWVICLGCAILYFATTGLACNVFSVYSPFILAEHGFTKTQVSLIGTSRALFGVIAILCTAKYYMHISLRNGMLLAGLVCSSGYFVYGISNSFPMYLLGSALSGFGYGLGSMTPISMMLTRWFKSRKASATGIAAASSGLATLGIPSLLTNIIQSRSLHAAFTVEASAMALLVLLCWLLLRDYPSDKGLLPFEEGNPETGSKDRVRRSRSLDRPVLGKGHLALASVMILLCCAFNSAGFGNITLLCSTQGFPSNQVALSVTAAGGMLMVAKLLFGILGEKITLRRTSLIYLFCLIAGNLGLCFIGRYRWLMFPSTALFGGSLSCFAVGLVSWVDEWFPPEQHDRMVIRFQFLYSFGGLAMSVVPGFWADRCGGSYVPFYLFSEACAIFCTVSLAIIYHTVNKRKEELSQA